MQWYNVSDKLPEFNEQGWANHLLFWDGDTLYSGSCQNRGGNPVFIDWWVGGCDVDAQWWAPWPNAPTAEQCGAPAEQSGNTQRSAKN
jgi:hypothetical protein